MMIGATIGVVDSNKHPLFKHNSNHLRNSSRPSPLHNLLNSLNSSSSNSLLSKRSLLNKHSLSYNNNHSSNNSQPNSSSNLLLSNLRDSNNSLHLSNHRLSQLVTYLLGSTLARLLRPSLLLLASNLISAGSSPSSQLQQLNLPVAILFKNCSPKTSNRTQTVLHSNSQQACQV